MLPLSLGMALTVRVGQALGRGKLRHARFVAFNGVACALAAAFVIDLLLPASSPIHNVWYTNPYEQQSHFEIHLSNAITFLDTHQTQEYPD